MSTPSRALRLRGPLLSPISIDRAEVYSDALIEIDTDGRIAAVGPWQDEGDLAARRLPLFDTDGALILPAFVDAHVHLPQIDVRGRYGLSLLAWLDRWVYPAEAAFSDPDHAAAVAERFFAALASAGTGTASVFATVHVEATTRAFEAAEASGLRIVMGKVLMDRNAPRELVEPADPGIRASLALADRWEGAGGGRLHYAVTPRYALSCSPELLAAAGRTTREAGLRLQTHVAEQTEEVARVRTEFPEARDYLEVYERAGMVRPGAVFAHAVHCEDDAYRRLAAGGAAIACCPTSNAFLGSGAFPLARARAAGVTIAAGSDVGAGPQLSLLDVLRHIAYLGPSHHEVGAGSRTADGVSPEELLYRATLAGAEALGFPETGRIAPGLSADFVILAPPPDATGEPLERFVQSVFRQPETRVVATLVEGRVVHGRLPSLQENL
ncbi:MAG: guanine deaminase [Gemmatimonadota bacterium]